MAKIKRPRLKVGKLVFTTMKKRIVYATRIDTYIYYKEALPENIIIKHPLKYQTLK